MQTRPQNASSSASARSASISGWSPLARTGLLVTLAAILLSLLGACAPRGSGGAESAAYVPATGQSRGVIVPNALPGTQTAPDNVSAAGSAISRSTTGAYVPDTGSAQGIRVPNAR